MNNPNLITKIFQKIIKRNDIRKFKGNIFYYVIFRLCRNFLNSYIEIKINNFKIFASNEKNKTLELFEKQKENVQVNTTGTYIKALEKVASESEIIKFYLENIKVTADPIHPYRMYEYILKNNVDINNYFTKRLIFINMFYR